MVLTNWRDSPCGVDDIAGQALLSCRALNTIIDINPRACELILPAVPTLCSRLANLDDIDVAEQCAKW